MCIEIGKNGEIMHDVHNMCALVRIMYSVAVDDQPIVKGVDSYLQVQVGFLRLQDFIDLGFVGTTTARALYKLPLDHVRLLYR